MTNPPVDVQEYGQSIWLDYIHRQEIDNGHFQNLIDNYGVVGVTSNPSIFQKAIGASEYYDDAIRNMLDFDAHDIYERLAVEDIQRATDLFRAVYDRTDARDGYVSLEVSPLLANSTEETVAEAQRLYKTVDRPNLMIKIPATPAGIPAIEETIAAGINVNVTLIFAVKNYEQVAEAFIRGLERRLEAGESVQKIASVASFFLSRIDTMVDNILENNIRAAQVRGDTVRIAANRELLGKAAIASAKLAYAAFNRLFNGQRFAKLREAGAQVQRPLWASTSTKNPAYPDTMYVDTLIGADTVNTLPPNTLDAFRDHGTAAETLKQRIDDAQHVMDKLFEIDVDMVDVTQRLQDDGVEAFSESFESLMTQVEAKRTILATGVMDRQKLALGIYGDDVQKAIEQMDKAFINGRIWAKDGTVWKSQNTVITKIVNRLGWLDVLDTMDMARLQVLQDSVKGKVSHVVLLGMGGSSLAPEVLYQTFGKQDGFPELLVLDSTSPDRIKDIEDAIDLKQALFIVASKSGGTVETLSFYKYFYEKTGNNGKQFIAITDSGSQLEQTAREQNFLHTFVNPEDIGGRYSALSYFGLVPAALIGLDLKRFWDRATNMIRASNEHIPGVRHPGMTLGVVLGVISLQGRDKVSIYCSQSIASFGHWVEQLIAESIGKEGKGLVPVVGATVGMPHDYATDRMFVYLKVEGDPDVEALDEGVRALREAGHPRVTLILPDRYELAGEFFRWEYATAIAGKLYSINPFDEPNVTEAKQATNNLLAHYQEYGALPETEPVMESGNIGLYAAEGTLSPLRHLCKEHGYNSEDMVEVLAAQFIGTRANDYFAFLAYLNPTDEVESALQGIRRRLRHVTKRAVTIGYGPRYLHSTGQLHKGGDDNGIFIQLTKNPSLDLAIPDTPYSFGTLFAAQAAGDLQALSDHKRRAIRLHIGADFQEAIDLLNAAIDFAEHRRR